MEARRLVYIVATALGLTGVLCLALMAYWSHQQTDFNVLKLTAAVHAFRAELKAQAKPLPKSVTLQQLLDKGYLLPRDVVAFKGMGVTLPLSTNDTNPEAPLMLVQLPDGSASALLSDGSVQALSAQRLQDCLKQLEPDSLSPTNPPSHPQTTNTTN